MTTSPRVSTRRSETAIASFALFVIACVLSGRAVGQSPIAPQDEELARLEANVQGGRFLVLFASSTSWVILGRATGSFANGRVHPLQLGDANLAIATAPLGRTHPAFLDAVAGQPVRVADQAGVCEARLGVPVVAKFVDLMASSWGLDLEGRPHNTASDHFRGVTRGDWVAVPIVGTCGGILATTTTVSAPRLFQVSELDGADALAIDDAYRTTDSFRQSEAELERAREEFGPDADPTLFDVRTRSTRFSSPRFPVLVFASRPVPSSGCNDGPDFPVLFEGSGAARRVVGTPTSGPLLLIDIDGDGIVEVVFETGTRRTRLFQLRPDQAELDSSFEFSIEAAMGC